MMSSENTIFSYTKRDYEGSRKEGMARIPILSKGLWTDLNAGDPGVVILDYMHALADMCNYYLDHQALEMFIATSKERANLFRLAQNASYQVRSAKGAKVDVRMYLPENAVYDTAVSVPKNTVLTTSSRVSYLTTEDALITDTQIPVVVPCIQGEIVQEVYTGTGLSSNIPIAEESDRVNEDQSIKLSGLGIDADTIQVVDNTGTIWDPIEHLIFTDTPSKVYQKVVDPEHRVTVRFGNDVRGYAPKTSDVLTISYVNTEGDAGKIMEESLKGSINCRDVSNNQVSVTYYNPYPSTGGSYGETDEELRRNIMTMSKTLGRAVTREDFEHLAYMIDGVRSVAVYDIESAPDLCLYHEVKVIILPDSSVESNQELINEVSDNLKSKSIPPTNILVSMPTKTLVPITIKVKKLAVLPVGESSTTDDVRECIEDYFNNSIGIGEEFNPFTLSSRIASLPAVRSIISMTPTSTVPILQTSIAALGALNISVE